MDDERLKYLLERRRQQEYDGGLFLVVIVTLLMSLGLLTMLAVKLFQELGV